MRFSYCQCVILHFECLKTSYKEFLTHTRQHRHLKRKDSIRFLVLLVFLVFSSSQDSGMIFLLPAVPV